MTFTRHQIDAEICKELLVSHLLFEPNFFPQQIECYIIYMIFTSTGE